MSADKNDKTITSRTPSNHSVRHVRVPWADPRQKVSPARENPVHMAIVITCLTVMLVTAVAAGADMLRGGISVPAAWAALAVTTAANVTMSLSTAWFRRRPR